MVGHTDYKNIDPEYPASISKKNIDVIRELGFDGIMYTDSFGMMGILQKYGEQNAMVCALNAGNDIILPNYRTSSREIYEMMLDAYRQGLIPDERLDDAVRHVMAEEARCAKVPEHPIEVPDNMAEILDRVVRDSITADCLPGVPTALDPEARRLFIVLTPQDYVEGPIGEISAGKWYYPQIVREAILESFPNAEVVTLPEYPNANQNDTVLTAATKHEEIVFVSFCQSGCYLGSDGLTRRVETVFRALAASGKVSAHVHFGNPNALYDLPKVARRLYGYNATPAQKYAIEVLAGKIPAKGKKPFPKFM
jgi:beta-N-acetylhexosaminidase